MAVNFYKFAAAVMQLLEPEKYRFSVQNDLAARSNQSDADLLGSVEVQNNLYAAADTDVAASSLLNAEQETKTVEGLAARLTETIANASAEKLEQVAVVIEKVAAETKQTEEAPNLISTLR